MNLKNTEIDGVHIIEPRIYEDERGFFFESFQEERYKTSGIQDNFVQDNFSRSMKNVLRGFHYQKRHPQSQIVTLVRGEIYDVLVDLRKSSPTFKKWIGIHLSERGVRQIYMPGGVAHGYFTLSDVADLHYKVSRKYDPADEGGLVWNDSEIGVKWPEMPDMIISTRDRKYPRFRDLKDTDFPS